MKKLSIQIQPHRAPKLKASDVRSALESVASRAPLVHQHWFDEGKDGEEYFNFTFETEDLAGLWQLIESRIFSEPSWGDLARRASIVTCEGKDGWDDYLVLHHFDPAVGRAPLDYLKKLSRPLGDFGMPQNTAVLTCERVLSGSPILFVSCDEEGEWSFLCGGKHADGGCPGKLVSIAGILKIDPSVGEVADLCTGGSASRNAPGGEWAVHDGHEDKVLQDVREHGWHVALIEADDAGPAFAYSIGAFKSFGVPEVIIFGLSGDGMHAIVNTCIREFKAAGVPKAGVPIAGILETLPVVFREVKPDYFRNYLGYALWFYSGQQFPILQCVWPDRQGKFPWDQGFDQEFMSRQPLLG